METDTLIDRDVRDVTTRILRVLATLEDPAARIRVLTAIVLAEVTAQELVTMSALAEAP